MERVAKFLSAELAWVETADLHEGDDAADLPPGKRLERIAAAEPYQVSPGVARLSSAVSPSHVIENKRVKRLSPVSPANPYYALPEFSPGDSFPIHAWANLRAPPRSFTRLYKAPCRYARPRC